MAKMGLELLENAYKDVYLKYPNPRELLGIPYELEKFLKLRLNIKGEIKEQPNYINRGKKWTVEEDNLLRKEFLDKLSITDIAIKHMRSSFAIRCRLEKYRLI